MLGKPLLLILALAVAASEAVNRGSIQVEGYGEVWVISPDWANVQVSGIYVHNSGFMFKWLFNIVNSGNGFTLYGNSRMYFASRPTDGFEADAYWQVITFDKSKLDL